MVFPFEDKSGVTYMRPLAQKSRNILKIKDLRIIGIRDVLGMAPALSMA